MPGRMRNTLLACAVAASLAGCGSGDDGTIPQDEAENLVRTLDGVETALASRDCDEVVAHADEFRDQVNALPADVDTEVRQGLEQGAAHLVELSNEPEQCGSVTGTSGEQGEQPSSTTTETAVEEATTTTEPTTTSTTTTEAEEEDGGEDPSAEEEQQAPPASDEGEGTGPPLEPPGSEGGGTGGRPGSSSGGVPGGKGGAAKRGRPAPATIAEPAGRSRGAAPLSHLALRRQERSGR
jgi:hypothetical protein